MTKDALGHDIEFGTVIRVGAPRRDKKYPVSFVFKSTGKRVNKVMTREQLDRELARSPRAEVFGYRRPLAEPTGTPPGADDVGELMDMEDLLERAGYDRSHAARLSREGMGPEELRGRLAVREGVGSLPHTHGIRRKTAAQLGREVDAFLADQGSGGASDRVAEIVASYRPWESTYSNEDSDRAVSLALRLTDVDREEGRPAPPAGFSEERYEQARQVVRDANLYGEHQQRLRRARLAGG
jgi:hypothetical protein